MPNDPGPAVGEPLVLHRRQKRLGLRFNRLRKQTAGAIAQNRGQRIVDLIGVVKGNDGGICRHGVSLLLEVLAGLITASIRRHPQTFITHSPP